MDPHFFLQLSALLSLVWKSLHFFSCTPQKVKLRVKKKTIVPTIVCGFKRIVFLTEIDEEKKLNEHKNDVLVLSASKAHTKNIYLWCVYVASCVVVVDDDRNQLHRSQHERQISQIPIMILIQQQHTVF